MQEVRAKGSHSFLDEIQIESNLLFRSVGKAL
jgi:hypothetical protein